MWTSHFFHIFSCSQFVEFMWLNVRTLFLLVLISSVGLLVVHIIFRYVFMYPCIVLSRVRKWTSVLCGWAFWVWETHGRKECGMWRCGPESKSRDRCVHHCYCIYEGMGRLCFICVSIEVFMHHPAKHALCDISMTVWSSTFLPTLHWGAPTSSLVARWAAVWRVMRSILHWGNVSSQLHLISPGCPRPNSALTVQKSGLKHRSSIHQPYIDFFV